MRRVSTFSVVVEHCRCCREKFTELEEEAITQREALSGTVDITEHARVWNTCLPINLAANIINKLKTEARKNEKFPRTCGEPTHEPK